MESRRGRQGGTIVSLARVRGRTKYVGAHRAAGGGRTVPRPQLFGHPRRGTPTIATGVRRALRVKEFAGYGGSVVGTVYTHQDSYPLVSTVSVSLFFQIYRFVFLFLICLLDFVKPIVCFYFIFF